MEADDLLCSRNARSRTPLVGRTQWKISQLPSLERDKQAWREHVDRSTRAVEGFSSLPAWECKRGKNWKDDWAMQARETGGREGGPLCSRNRGGDGG